jgi:hypothetical protein
MVRRLKSITALLVMIILSVAPFPIPFCTWDWVRGNPSSAILVYENMGQPNHLQNGLQEELKGFASRDSTRAFLSVICVFCEFPFTPLQVYVQNPKVLVLRC